MLKNLYIILLISFFCIGCAKRAGNLATSPFVEIDVESNSQGSNGLDEAQQSESAPEGQPGDSPLEENPLQPPQPLAFADGHYAVIEGGALKTFLAFSDDQYCEHDFPEKFSNFNYTDLSMAQAQQFTESRQLTTGPHCDGHYSTTDAAGNPELFVMVTGKVCKQLSANKRDGRVYIELDATERAFLLSQHVVFTGAPCL